MTYVTVIQARGGDGLAPAHVVRSSLVPCRVPSQEDFSDVLETESRAEVQASTALPPPAPAAPAPAAAPNPWLPSVAPAQAPAPSPFLLPPAAPGAGAGAPEPGFRFLFAPPPANAVQPVATSPFAVAPNAAGLQQAGEEGVVQATCHFAVVTHSIATAFRRGR
jgi:hypothetical protein